MKPRRRKAERGFATIYLGISILALAAVATLGVDVGRIAFTATEVQSAADTVATTGAKQLILGTANPRTDAEDVLAANMIDGHAGQKSEIQTFETGNYDGTTDSFSAGGTPANAVRAVVSTQVNNILTAILGQPASTVTKTATAAFGSLGAGQPTLPLAIGDCLFPSPDCMDDSCLPKLLQVPSPEDNSAWTGFFDSASSNLAQDYFPAECGGSLTPPTIRTGEDINIINGETSTLKALEDCLAAGIDTFLVPIVECGIQYNQSTPVLGFATIHVTDVNTTGNPKYAQIDVMFNAEEPGPPGGGNFGSGSVVLVR